jgi:hypothetical protein
MLGRYTDEWLNIAWPVPTVVSANRFNHFV